MLLPRLVIGLLPAGLMFLTNAAPADDFPNRPIRIITAAAGGGSDTTARIIAQGVSGPLGQPVIVENRGTFAAVDGGAKAQPDGYTALVTGGSFWVNPLLQKMTYDPVKDFSPVTLISREVFILVVNPSVPVKSVKDLIALAKAKPGALNYGTSTPGGPGSLGAALLKAMTGVNIVNVPYKGTTAAVTGVIAGEIQFAVADIPLVAPNLKSGKLLALGVTSAEPTALAPGIPTVAASGLPGYELIGATGMWEPAKTPPAAIMRLNREVVRFLNQPEIRERFLSAQSEVVGNTSEQFAALIKSEIIKWGKVIKEAGISAS